MCVRTVTMDIITSDDVRYHLSEEFLVNVTNMESLRMEAEKMQTISGYIPQKLEPISISKKSTIFRDCIPISMAKECSMSEVKVDVNHNDFLLYKLYKSYCNFSQMAILFNVLKSAIKVNDYTCVDSCIKDISGELCKNLKKCDDISGWSGNDKIPIKNKNTYHVMCDFIRLVITMSIEPNSILIDILSNCPITTLIKIEKYIRNFKEDGFFYKANNGTIDVLINLDEVFSPSTFLRSLKIEPGVNDTNEYLHNSIYQYCINGVTFNRANSNYDAQGKYMDIKLVNRLIKLMTDIWKIQKENPSCQYDLTDLYCILGTYYILKTTVDHALSWPSESSEGSNEGIELLIPYINDDIVLALSIEFVVRKIISNARIKVQIALYDKLCKILHDKILYVRPEYPSDVPITDKLIDAYIQTATIACEESAKESHRLSAQWTESYNNVINRLR